MARVIITSAIPNAAEEVILQAGHELSIASERRSLSRRELLQAAEDGFDAFITMLSDRIDDEFLSIAAPACKIVANYAVGYNNVDLQAAAKHNVYITNTPDVLTDTTADLAWALLMATARRIVEGDRYIRRESSTGLPGWNGWNW